MKTVMNKMPLGMLVTAETELHAMAFQKEKQIFILDPVVLRAAAQKAVMGKKDDDPLFSVCVFELFLNRMQCYNEDNQN